MIASTIAVVTVWMNRLETNRLDTVKGVVNQVIPIFCAINVMYISYNAQISVSLFLSLSPFYLSLSLCLLFPVSILIQVTSKNASCTIYKTKS